MSTQASLAAGEYLIDLPQKSDAAAIARCFLEVYGHHYIHSEVFSPRRYWERVESGELIPVVARDEKGEVIGHVALERELERSWPNAARPSYVRHTAAIICLNA